MVIRHNNPCLLTHEIEELKDARVSNLLDVNGRWDEELIRDIFDPQDVPRILSTPVSPEYEDSWCWFGDIRRVYTAKHGSSKVPPKIHNFMWRCVMNVLPVCENLRSKRVFIGGGCPLCPADMETGKPFLCFVESIYEKPDAHDAVLMAARFWTSWLARNDKAVYANTVSNHLPSPSPAIRSPPPSGMLKCNVDAAITEGFRGAGLVIHDHHGNFVAAYATHLSCGCDPYLAEALAIKEDLTWIKARGITQIIIETDCMNFYNSFQSSHLDLSYVGVVIRQCVDIARDIGDVSVHHILRSVTQTLFVYGSHLEVSSKD
ncbi:PREDICTED: uncharacterized protein LOC109192159 [Ipomoea nil]|uniref:uncharacterized protein LOC109192159 n=1 Tax=Ipomoea nil TaxID=35883 RepID=UPI000901DF9E|nr:PREDICTED: uncharacterized protein LOC109192159 [Ipomoea nil]